jgi:myo-inositol-1(or 4)-monophosphatase
MGEETFRPRDTLRDKPTFTVDPIDGITNFVHGDPYSCVSLGLAVEKEPVMGVVFDPFTNSLYTGIIGKGSYLTDAAHGHARLPLEEMRDLSHCLIVVE